MEEAGSSFFLHLWGQLLLLTSLLLIIITIMMIVLGKGYQEW